MKLPSLCNVGISDENDAFCGNNLGDLKLNDNQGTNAIPLYCRN